MNNDRQEGVCPFCGTTGIIYKGLRVDGDTVVHNCACLECKQNFTEEEPLEFPEN